MALFQKCHYCGGREGGSLVAGKEGRKEGRGVNCKCEQNA